MPIAIERIAVNGADRQHFVSIDFGDVRAGTKTVGNIVCLKAGPIAGQFFGAVLRANQQFCSGQLIGHEAKVQIRVAVEAILVHGAKLHGAAGIDAHIERILITVVSFPQSEPDANLLQVADTIDMLRLGAIFNPLPVPTEIKQVCGREQADDN